MPSLARWKWPWRTLAKLTLFGIVTLLVLYPRVDLLVKQVIHLGDWDALIDPNLPAMPEINAEIDKRLPPGAPPAVELSTVQRFVYEKIPYRYDWFTWGNVDYWPTAAEVWEKKREDCDGRAVLAASILRARGFTTAHLAGNLDHVWVVLDANDPKAANAQRTGLMNPQARENFSREGGKVSLAAPDIDTLRQSLQEMAHFPAWRTAMIVITGLALLYHPCRHGGGFTAVLAIGFAGMWQLYDWGVRSRGTGGIDEASDAEFILAVALLAAATIGAIFAHRVFGQHRAEPRSSAQPGI